MSQTAVEKQGHHDVKLLQILSNRQVTNPGDISDNTSNSTLAFEQLASTLLNFTQNDLGKEALKTFAIIGATAGAGASTVAINLAHTLANSNKNVLVVKIEPNAKSDNNTPDKIDMAIEEVENFHYMEISVAWLSQIASKNETMLTDIMRDLDHKFAHIIWDLPPADKSAWSRLICQSVGGVILVVHAGKTRWRSAKYMLHSLQFAGANVLGVVLNKKKCIFLKAYTVFFSVTILKKFVGAMIMRNIKSVFFAALALALSACTSFSNVPEVQTQKATTAMATPAPSYIINAGDTIDIKFFYNKELNDSVTVRPDGNISLQLAHEIKAAGLTPTELEKKLTDIYAKKLHSAPDLSVIVKGFESQRIYVTGEVEKTGELKLDDKMTALQAVAAAGGLKNTADKENILIIRQKADGTSEVFKADFSDDSIAYANTGTAHAQLQPRDLVYVPKSGISKTNLFVDQYIRQMLMFNGFSANATAIYDLNNSNRGF